MSFVLATPLTAQSTKTDGERISSLTERHTVKRLTFDINNPSNYPAEWADEDTLAAALEIAYDNARQDLYDAAAAWDAEHGTDAATSTLLELEDAPGAFGERWTVSFAPGAINAEFHGQGAAPSFSLTMTDGEQL